MTPEQNICLAFESNSLELRPPSHTDHIKLFYTIMFHPKILNMHMYYHSENLTQCAVFLMGIPNLVSEFLYHV